MRRGVRWIGLAVLLAAMPALAADETKKDADKDKDKKAPAARSPLAPPAERKESKYTNVRVVVGKVQKFEGDELALEVQSGIGRYARKETIDLTLAEDAKFRTKNPPLQLDEKDRPKKLTSEELRKLKGDDPKLPGYTAERAALTKGQVVEVQLSQLKGAKRPSAKDKAAGKEDLVVTLVVITSQDAPPGAMKGSKAGKK